ncbi:hypothetical protein D3C78_848640 [compost metagenome]
MALSVLLLCRFTGYQLVCQVAALSSFRLGSCAVVLLHAALGISGYTELLSSEGDANEAALNHLYTGDERLDDVQVFEELSRFQISAAAGYCSQLGLDDYCSAYYRNRRSMAYQLVAVSFLAACLCYSYGGRHRQPICQLGLDYGSA